MTKDALRWGPSQEAGKGNEEAGQDDDKGQQHGEKEVMECLRGQIQLKSGDQGAGDHQV